MLRRLRELFWPAVKSEPLAEVVFPPDASLLQLEGFAPERFSFGIEILNDRQTSMEFVVSVLQKHLGMTRNEALLTAIKIHGKGGVILEQPSYEHAKQLSSLIMDSAREANFPLVCRAIAAEPALDGALHDPVAK